MIHDYLPDAGDMLNAPERAHLAMLSTAAHLAEQALLIEYPDLDEVHAPCDVRHQPLLLSAYLIAQRTTELRGLIAWHQAALEAAIYRALTHKSSEKDDLPF
jgi:hypothetical protein